MSYQGSNNVENNTKMLEKVEKMIEQQQNNKNNDKMMKKRL
jgi:hypothetical protein